MQISTDTFIDIAKENHCIPKATLAALVALNPAYKCNVTQIKNRIANYRRKGLLPLDSGNIVSTGEFLKGTSTLYDAQGSIKQQWIKTDVGKEDSLEAFKEAIENVLQEKTFSYEPIELPKHINSDLMTIYPIGDAHVGMLAHAAETGADHDLNISKNVHIAAINLAVDQALNSEQAFIIDVGDWFHADDSNNRTPRGNNPLDVDGRYHKVIEVGFEIAVEMIKAALTKHKIVHWRSAEGEMIALL